MRVEVDAVLAQRSRVVRAASRARVGGSILVHLLVIGGCAVAPLLAAQGRQTAPEFVPVMVVPAQALGVAEPTPAPSRPRPAPEPEPETEPPPAPTEEEEAPEPEPEPAMPSPTRKPQRAEPQRPPPAPAASGELGRRKGSPTGSSTGTSAFGVDQDSFADQNFTYSYYIDQMLAMIQSEWQRPSLGAQIEAALFFRIHRNGQVTDLRVVDSSGYNVFDLAGLRAVQQAAPFPRLPVSYPRKALAVKLILR